MCREVLQRFKASLFFQRNDRGLLENENVLSSERIPHCVMVRVSQFNLILI